VSGTIVGFKAEKPPRQPTFDAVEIFRYGHDVMHPPLMNLAKPIAERGAMAVPFLLDQLNSQPDDITILGILLIFKTMASSKSCDLKSDAALMSTLASKVSGMKDKEWQTICLKRLQRIKDAT